MTRKRIELILSGEKGQCLVLMVLSLKESSSVLLKCLAAFISSERHQDYGEKDGVGFFFDKPNNLRLAKKNPIPLGGLARNPCTRFSASSGSLFNLTPPQFWLACDPPRKTPKFYLHAIHLKNVPLGLALKRKILLQYHAVTCMDVSISVPNQKPHPVFNPVKERVITMSICTSADRFRSL